MRSDRGGKTLWILTGVIGVLLFSMTVISVFFFLKEVELRRATQRQVDQLQQLNTALNQQLEDKTQALMTLEAKYRDQEERIENLTEELELEQGLREELKKENRQLREVLEKERQQAMEAKQRLHSDLSAAQETIARLQKQLEEEENRRRAIEEQLAALQEQAAASQNQVFTSTTQQDSSQTQTDGSQISPPAPFSKAEPESDSWQTIVINPDNPPQGSVVSVDEEAEFLIINLGTEHGIQEGMTLAVYRGNRRLGEIRVTRVLPLMSAADCIPPLTAKDVKTDDRVVINPP